MHMHMHMTMPTDSLTNCRYVREIDVLSQQYGSLKTKLQALGPEELVFRQPDDYSMTYRGSSLRGEPTLCADYMRRCGRHAAAATPAARLAAMDVSELALALALTLTLRVTGIRGPHTIATQRHMHMHRSGQLRDVLQPQQSAADGDGSAGEGAECAASSLHALHELWNVQHEHAAEVQPC